MHSVILPDLGETISAELIQWYYDEGDEVEQGRPIVELGTEEATIEILAPADGHILRQVFKPGDTVPVGAVLCEFEEASEDSAAG